MQHFGHTSRTKKNPENWTFSWCTFNWQRQSKAE